MLNEAPVPLATDGVRESVVAKLDEAMALADTVEVRLRKGLLHVERTLQAVLVKAFRGELVAGEGSQRDE